MSERKHIHFIGICGTLIAPFAVAMKKDGWKVTGSDQAFYPPMSTFLEENEIKVIPGFKPDKFGEVGKPDLAMMMGLLTPENPEVKYMIENGVELIGLGQLLERYFLRKNSIVITGNYGKTTITSIVAWILETAGYDPTVLAGGYLHNFGGGVKIGNSNWAVSEGDEFKGWHISKDYEFSRRPRIFYQKPTHLIFTDATWDHYDLYKTEAEYLDTFIELVKQLPKDGYAVGSPNGKNVGEILSHSKAKTEIPVIEPESVKYSASGAEFSLNGTSYKTNMLGRIGVENAALAITVAKKIGISDEDIQKALDSYKGVKRRQDIRFDSDDITIIDDFAHSPVKLRGLIDTLKLHYKKEKLILIYQPGSKDSEALDKYSPETFSGVDQLLLPKVSSLSKEGRLFNKHLADRLKETVIGDKVSYIDEDEQLVTHLCGEINRGNNKVLIVFAAQKGFRGMIEELINKQK